MTFTLPDLPYSFDALEPFIDARTMEIHHDKHHAGYVAKLNAAIEGHADLAEMCPGTICSNLEKVPENIRTAVRNNGGGHFNHSVFWKVMGPGSSEPTGALASAIDATFGDLASMKKQFAAAAATRFGSGWAWLVKDKDGSLKVTKTENGVNPICFDQTALLGCDVWEHSYYIDFRNARPDYLSNFLDNLVNWDNVASRL